MQNIKYKVLIFSLFTFHFLLFTTSDAHAMHISEGILPWNWAVLWFVVAVPFIGLGLYQLKKRSSIDLSFKPLVGFMAAVVFIISCMPVPVPTAGTCSHPCGTGMSGILLGPCISVIVASVALLIQALFLAHGGLSTWGADIVSMGVVGSFAGYLTFKAGRSMKMNMAVAGFFAGLFADWATYLTTSVELALGIRGDSPFVPLFIKIFVAFIPTQLPLGILEGAMTAGIVVLLYKKRPDLLIKMRVIKPEKKVQNSKFKFQSLGKYFLIIFLVSTPVFASDKWGGVDESVVEKYAEEHGREAREPLINTDQGDLLLFVFLLAGTVGGFIAGYCWRTLMKEKKEQ